MSLWYRTGTISVTNGSTTVSGSGTSWVGVVRVGDALIAPDGRSYEISAVVSNTSLTIASDYLGSTASDQDYAIQPTRGVAQEWLNTVQAFQGQVQGWADGPLSGLFGNGNAGAPGIAFASQPNTGLFRPESSVLALSVNGTERARLTSSGLEVMGALSGTAVTQSATDNTEDRITRVGDFGSGGVSPVIGDIEDNPASGIYTYDESQGSLNGPLRPDNQEPYSRGHVLVGRRETDEKQSFLFISETFPFRGEMYARAFDAVPSTGEWRRFYSTYNLVGTVSESGGDPTGAVMEADSNDDGSFMRLANGWQICRRKVLLDVTTTNVQSFSVPATFASVRNSISLAHEKNLTSNATRISNLRMLRASTSSFWAAVDSVDTADSDPDRDSVWLTAIGLWTTAFE